MSAARARATLVAVGLIAVVYATGCGGGGGQDGPATAKQLFIQTCGNCHALDDAGTTRTMGPDLDDLAPDAATVETAIREGGTGSGMMPANIYTGEQAKQVAAYVASVAGRE